MRMRFCNSTLNGSHVRETALARYDYSADSSVLTANVPPTATSCTIKRNFNY